MNGLKEARLYNGRKRVTVCDGSRACKQAHFSRALVDGERFDTASCLRDACRVQYETVASQPSVAAFRPG